MKLLIVEDEPDMVETLRQSLRAESYLVETATTFNEAMDKISGYDYDCILLDIMLPGGNGIQLLQHLKSMNRSDNVIIISAKDSVDDKILGLEKGADDYLTKPFHLAELTARIKSVLRRKSQEGKDILQAGNVSIDTSDRSASVNGAALNLNRKEFDVLYYLTLNRNRLVNKTSLAEHVWGDHIDQADDFDFIYSQIKNLRKKLKDAGAELEIQAVYGIGYKLVVS
jgi:DNA-binding response OmpR family regulator